MEETFKAGDWVLITKSSNNWNERMNQFVGKSYKIRNINQDRSYTIFEDNNIHAGRDYINYWTWNHNHGHFVKSTTNGVINNFRID